jgi:formylglycine-generating enzyme required for sulfatase activity/energy-coupling factor transporter ATP-binding protein EcfA2
MTTDSERRREKALEDLTRRYMQGEISEEEYDEAVRTISTGGGAYVGGDVHTGRDFVGRDQIHVDITWPTTPFDLADEPDLAQLRADYLSYLRDAHQYLDFKGIPQVERVALQLPLDAVYVPLRARPEMPAADTWLRLAGRMWRGEDPASLEALAVEGRVREVEPVFIEEALAQYPTIVVLGDPGAGKSTLLKVLALALARQPDGPLPILLPLNAYAEALARAGEMTLQDFLPGYYATRQRKLAKLAPLFDAALESGQAVVLLDGLDEVQINRPYLVGLVEDFVADHIPEGRPTNGKALAGNRVVVTSRIVGYREAPFTGQRWRTYTLVDFRREEITRFADRWCVAFEIAAHGDTELARAQAIKERDELLASIFANPGIEQLASNPLLLTILALIKRQGVTLPEQRVELYELYLKTLIHAWNKARTLDRRPVGPEMPYLETVQVLSPLALWLRETNPTAGLVPRTDLEGWLASYYQEEWAKPRGEALSTARAFLESVRRYSNLLVERGRDQYGFLHLTLEEMLAAKGIAQKSQWGLDQALRIILDHLDEPAWHETILLAVGVWGIVQQQPRVAGEVLKQLCQQGLVGEACGRNVILAGEAVLDVGEVGVGRGAAAYITDCLVHTMQDRSAPVGTRRQAGLLLGRLAWRPDDLDNFVPIAPGRFLYGDEREKREIPYRYWIAKYLVTNAQFARFLEDDGYHRREFWSDAGWAWRTGEYDSQAPDVLGDWLKQRPPEKRDRPFWWGDIGWASPIFPVVGVSWFEAQAYANWLATWLLVQPDLPGDLKAALSKGAVTRLPAEEEWERAMRGTDGRQYPWGDALDLARLNCVDAWAGQVLDDEGWEKWVREKSYERAGSTAVCTYPDGVSPERVWDGAGNVWEWMASEWEPGSGTRALRGGSWVFHHRNARCAYRNHNHPDLFDNSIGFRLVVAPALAPE